MNRKSFIPLVAIATIMLFTAATCNTQTETTDSPNNTESTTETNNSDKMDKENGDSMEKEDDEAMKKDSGEAMEKESGETMEKMEKDDTSDTMEKNDSATQAGSYEEYSADKLARAENGDVVLFFHAPWCPTCKALDSNINANATNIPDGVTILKVDYDSENELRSKYGVTYQHTLVQVDANGDVITKWAGGNTLTSITNRIQ